ncbi:hypothetical protein ACU8NU_17870 [Rhizobium leguminosarum]
MLGAEIVQIVKIYARRQGEPIEAQAHVEASLACRRALLSAAREVGRLYWKSQA